MPLALELHAKHEQREDTRQYGFAGVAVHESRVDTGRCFGSPRRQFTANLSAREFVSWTRPLYIELDAYVGARTWSTSSFVDGSLIVIRQSVRGSSGSVSVAEWSSEALSQITTSPTR